MSGTILLDAGIFFKKYEMCNELGKGCFGVVFQVKEREDGKSYAAKHIEIKNQEQKSKVMEEIKILRKLKHPQIMEFIGAYEKPEEIFLVTELLNGGELFERIVSDDFEFTESKSAAYIRQLLQGLDYLHKNNIIHLDIKPENIVCVNKESMDIKIIDFGLAVCIDPGIQIRTAGGTADYMAPEQLSYDCISTATDMWTVGVLCYILLSGLLPFTGNSNGETHANIRDINYCLDYPEFHWISQDAKEFIFGLLQKDQGSRMTAQQCLDHPWLIKQQSEHVINTENMKSYLCKRKMKKCYNAIVAINRLAVLETPPMKDDLTQTEDEEMKNTNIEETLTKDELTDIDDKEEKNTNMEEVLTKDEVTETDGKENKTIQMEDKTSVQSENAEDHSKLKEDFMEESNMDHIGAKLDPIEVETFDQDKFIKLVIDDTLDKLDVTLKKPSPLKLFSSLFSCFRRKRKYKIKH